MGKQRNIHIMKWRPNPSKGEWQAEEFRASAKLKNPPKEFPHGYPSYEIITANGMTDIIEHMVMEPVFYVTDDDNVWKELLGVRASNP